MGSRAVVIQLGFTRGELMRFLIARDEEVTSVQAGLHKTA